MITNRISNRFGAVVPIEKKVATIHMVQSSRFASRLAKLLLVGLFVCVFAMAFLPWQQTSRGRGEVVAFDPQERQQTVKATAKGIVIRIADGLVEGVKVKKDQVLLEIQPFAGDMVRQIENQLSALSAKKQTAQAKANAYEENVKGFEEMGDFAVGAAKQLVAAAEAKLESKQKQVAAYTAKEWQARLNFNRQESLWKKGFKPEKEVEKLKKELDVAVADLESVNQEVIALEKELSAKENELSEKRLLAKTKVEYAKAQREQALGEIETVKKEEGDLKIKLRALDRLIIKAPRDGTVFRLNVNEINDTVKEGDPLMTIVPETTKKAVELYVVGNDMPLVEIGQEVRLQFEGWPAVQFAGWPSVAVGTFSGTVSIVDATDNGKGEFRVLVTPNEKDDQEWPSDRFLLQGVRANGWVMLRRVSLGYEIWRQLNGFPVIVSEDEPKKEKVKTPKLPK